jgi:hypothetical protein
VHGVEGEGNEENDQVCGSDPLVTGTDREHLGSDGPGNSEGVELLDVGTRPDAGTFNRDENLSLVLDDAR